MKVLGIDPGINGGAAIIEITDGAAPRLLDAIDVPTVGSGAKQRVNVAGLRQWIQSHRPDYAAVERGQAMPRQGASSGFKFGRACGALEATVACCEIPVSIIEACGRCDCAAATKRGAASARSNSSHPHTRCSHARRIISARRPR
jgi:Holliday junction resolvasome RuvABC endonuclease subunit